MEIRDVTAADWPALWEIIRPIVRAGETYTYDPQMDEATARALWLGGQRVSVAVLEGAVVGTGRMGPNKDGPGAHIANGSYMVDGATQGRGVGRALVVESLGWARASGYRGMQFNAVAETNVGALGLYDRLGFQRIGCVPGGFRHPVEGDVGLWILFHDLSEV